MEEFALFYLEMHFILVPIYSTEYASIIYGHEL